MDGLPVNLLQKIGWTAKTLKGTVAAGAARCDRDVIYGLTDDMVMLDGIFGAFFEGYWACYTGIQDVELTFDLVGRIELSIVRISSRTGERTWIEHSIHEGAGERIVIQISLARSGETRLCLTLRFVTDGLVSSAAWATRKPPVRAANLTAIICTFNREKDLAATIDELLGKDSALQRLLVVNQGEPGLAERLAIPCVGHSIGEIKFIDQRNLGGAGGFGRGMLEALGDDSCSHVLLMDDDIDLDATIIVRLRAILSYLKEDYVIGGAMLDREKRTRLFSVGDILHDTKPEILNLVDPLANEITEELTTRYLARDHHPDFNGWWFCAIPLRQILKSGLPLPLFIRGDDVEYGYRLKLSNIRTLAWPGLAIWHDPFYTKRHPWHYFYDRRNSLFLCEMHGRIGRFRLVGTIITGFLSHLLRFDYDRANCIALGLKAFNHGVSGLEGWNAVDHIALTATFGSKEYLWSPTSAPQPLALADLPVPLLFAFRLMQDLTRRTRPSCEPVEVGECNWRPGVRHRPLSVRVCYAESQSALDLKHDRRRAQRCTLLLAGEVLRFLVRRWRPARLAKLTGRDFWACYTTQPFVSRR